MLSKGSSKAAAKAAAAADDHPSCFADTHGLILVTSNDIPGYRIVRVLGTVYGITVRSRNIGADIGTAFKSMVGGELRPLTKMLYSGRNESTERMIGECMARGGNAIVAMRYDTNESQMISQFCAYGTAVVIEAL